MGAFLFTILIIGLLITGGVVLSVRLHALGALGTGRFRRIRRSRSVRAVRDGTVIEETVEVINDGEAPLEEEEV